MRGGEGNGKEEGKRKEKEGLGRSICPRDKERTISLEKRF